MTFRAALSVLAIGVAACGPVTVNQAPSPPSSSPSIVPHTPGPRLVTAVYMVAIPPSPTNAGGDALHVVTVSFGVPTDRVLENADQYRQLLAQGMALRL